MSTLLPPVPWEWPGQCRAFHLVFHFICRMIWRQCAPWLIVAHDLLEYMQTHAWMTSWENCFLCFAQHGAQIWKCVFDYFGFGRWISKEKKFTRSYLQRRKMEKWRQKEFLTTLRMSINCKKSLQQLNCDHCVIAARDLLFRKMFSHIILLWATKDFKNSSK